VAGIDTLKHHTYEMAKHVGLVFQNPENQLFALSIEKDVAFGWRTLGFQEKKCAEKWIGHLTKRASTIYASVHLTKSRVGNSNVWQ